MEHKISVHQAILQRFSDSGLNVSDLLLTAGILASEFPLHISVPQFTALIDAIVKQTDNPLIGLAIGTVDNVSQLDATSFATVHSKDLADGLMRMARYKKLICPEDIHWQIENDSIIICNQWLGDIPLSPILTDGFFANIYSMLTLALGEVVKPNAIRLRRDSIPLSYAEFFGCQIELSAQQDEIIYPIEILHRPFLTYNPDLLALILPNLDNQVSNNALPNLAEQVKQVLFVMMNGNKPTIDNVAQRLHVSKRTLQRKLADIGLNYQSLLDEVRLTIAKEMLHQTTLENGEIAFYLGFEEVNSFHRFFVKQAGQTPSEWRDSISKTESDRIKSC